MKDVNNALFKAYYDAITALDIMPVYEGEEPDDVKDKLYCVISDPVITEVSTDNSSDMTATIQVSVHSWEYKYNSSYTLNANLDVILQALKPTSSSVLDLSAFNFQMMNLKVDQDRTERFGELGGKNYISRIIIFSQQIFVIS